MTHSLPPKDNTMDEAASLWAARLDGSDLDNPSRHELSLWLASDPRHRTLLTEYCQFSADLEEKLPEFLSSDALELLDDKPAENTPRHWMRRFIAGGLAAAAAIALLLAISQPTKQQESLATPAAQRQSLELVDGSSVDLDARTSLSIDIDDSHRRVRMAEGAAFFAVSKDMDRPFIVETPCGSVRVKGTRFDVQSNHQDSLQVTVIEGVVQVNPADMGSDTSPVLLQAGDQLSLSHNRMVVRKLSETDLANTIAWRQGQVVFQGATLSTALNRFAHYHGIGISASPEASKLIIGGRFSLDDLNGFLTALEEVIPVRISRNLNGTIQVNLRESRSALTVGP